MPTFLVSKTRARSLSAWTLAQFARGLWTRTTSQMSSSWLSLSSILYVPVSSVTPSTARSTLPVPKCLHSSLTLAPAIKRPDSKRKTEFLALDILGDIGLEPGAARVTVDTALDEVVGRVSGDGGAGAVAGEDVEENAEDHRNGAERGHG